jgi:diaminopimelate epimerase
MKSSTWHALGNRYVVVESPPDARLVGVDARGLSRGADGVLEVIGTDEATVDVVIWNPDGSQAELSGNGTRIAAAWLTERTGAMTICVRVGAREVVAHVRASGEIEQELGAVTVGDAEVVAGIRFVPVDVGNPHAVVEGDPADVTTIGPLLETHARFPGRTNVQVARVDRPGEVTVRVWERGVGETTSSGTGAVAVAAATHGEGEVLVHFPGGDLRVRIEAGRAYLVGPAERLT